MKKAYKLCVVLTMIAWSIPFSSALAQKKIGEAKLPTGEYIVVFDDMTWMYRDVNKSIRKTSLESNRTIQTVKPIYKPTESSNNYSSTCGARTKKGGACRRVVKGGGRCWQH